MVPAFLILFNKHFAVDQDIKMIYLLGVDHQVQHARHAQITMIFSFYLSKKIKELNVALIAEEWSVDSSRISNVKTTVPEDLAVKHNLAHLYCDPTDKERKEIGWLSKKDNPVREKFWFDKMKLHIHQNMIFVCGADHLESFSQLLSDNKCPNEILPKRFDITSYLQSENKDL